MNDRTGRPAVFVRVTGQAMNVGDSVLRRAYITALRDVGQAHLLVRQMPQGYLDGLGVSDDDILYTSDAAWRDAFRASARRTPTTYAFNAGEMQFSRFYVQDLAASLPLLRLASRSGGGSLMLGVSMRARGSRWALALTPLLRAVGRVSWRDARSRQWTSLGTVAADWAFLEGDEAASPETDGDRPYLAVTLRGDRPVPTNGWFAAVRALADAKGLEVLAVSQVEVDTPLMREVAERLDARVIEMPAGASHAHQEELVRDAYRHSSVVVSDRLHALVMGATEGAIPLGLADDAAVKAARHFEVVGLHGVSVRTPDADPSRIDASPAARARVRAAVATARDQIAQLRASLVAGAGAPDVGAGRPLVVLQSSSAPDGTTKYIDQLVHEQAPDIRFEYFSWDAALRGDYDVFHVHWPDTLIKASSAPKRLMNRVRMRLLLRRLRRRGIPIVRTLHNLHPHEGATAPERRVLAALDDQTASFVRINSVTEWPAAAGATILHGHYVDRFAEHPTSEPIPGRILNFGLMRRYKGIDRLIDVFGRADDAALSLRLVGKVVEPDLRGIIDGAVAADTRITSVLRFVDDDELVAEVTAAELVVLPYSEMHNSGTLLVTLSLGRPALVPRSEVNEAIAAEVGPGWVILYDGELQPGHIAAALETARTRESSAPDLHARDWGRVSDGYAAVYRATARV